MTKVDVETITFPVRKGACVSRGPADRGVLARRPWLVRAMGPEGPKALGELIGTSGSRVMSVVKSDECWPGKHPSKHRLVRQKCGMSPTSNAQYEV